MTYCVFHMNEHAFYVGVAVSRAMQNPLNFCWMRLLPICPVEVIHYLRLLCDNFVFEGVVGCTPKVNARRVTGVEAFGRSLRINRPLAHGA